MDFRIITFSNLIESRGKIVGDSGYLLVKISRALRRVGSENEGVVKGLLGVSVVIGEGSI